MASDLCRRAALLSVAGHVRPAAIATQPATAAAPGDGDVDVAVERGEQSLVYRLVSVISIAGGPDRNLRRQGEALIDSGGDEHRDGHRAHVG